jgi:hypothetical protein
MAFRYLDPCGDYYTTLLNVWDVEDTNSVAPAGGAIVAAAGRFGSAGLRQTDIRQGITKNLDGNIGTIWVGFALNIEAHQTPETRAILRFKDAGLEQCALFLEQDGALRFYRRSGTLGLSPPFNAQYTALGAATSFKVPFLAYHYIEVKVVFNAGAGTFDLWVDGVNRQSLVGLNTIFTANAYCNQLGFGGAIYEIFIDSRRQFTVDDIYVHDSARQGDIRVGTIFPDGVGATSAWAANGAATLWQATDEVTPNEDTDYASSATVAQKYTTNMQPTGVGAGTVKTVGITARARKDDGATRIIRYIARHAGVEGQSSDRELGSTYSYAQKYFDTNPSTAVAWTIAEVDAMEAGAIVQA